MTCVEDGWERQIERVSEEGDADCVHRTGVLDRLDCEERAMALSTYQRGGRNAHVFSIGGAAIHSSLIRVFTSSPPDLSCFRIVSTP